MSKSKKDLKEDVIMEELQLGFNILTKFIKPYDGSRVKLNPFLKNCDNAFSLCSPSQEEVLLKYILSQLEDKAENACSIKEFSNWSNLKEFLKTQFGETKHTAHLLADLQECKQNTAETVTQFALRVETCLSQLLAEIKNSNFTKDELPGRIAGMEDLALHVFNMGLHPRLSNMVRCRNPTNLNEAVNIAVSEEKIQQIIYKTTKPVVTKPTYHPNPQLTQNPLSAFCRYCKKPGHHITNCRLRNYNNRRFNNNFPRTSNRVNIIEEESRDEVDNINLNWETSRLSVARDKLHIRQPTL